jgi:hypothetical protein
MLGGVAGAFVHVIVSISGRFLTDRVAAAIKKSIHPFSKNVAGKVALLRGVQAGTCLSAGIMGAGVELAAGQFEATNAHKKKIGYVAQVATAVAVGSTGWPAGAAISAAIGSVTWCASQVLSMAIKKAFEDEEEERLIPRGRKLSKRRDNEESIS